MDQGGHESDRRKGSLQELAGSFSEPVADSTGPRHQTRRGSTVDTIVYCALLGLSAVAFAAMATRFYGARTEDAFIVFRYARNLVEHGSLV